MVSTTLSRDIYQRHIAPDADDQRLLFVARVSAVLAGMVGVLLSIYLQTVTQALIIFYSLLGVTFFVPILAALLFKDVAAPEALAAVAAGVTTLLVIGFLLPTRPSWLDPSLSGIIAAAVAFASVMTIRRSVSHA